MTVPAICQGNIMVLQQNSVKISTIVVYSDCCSHAMNLAVVATYLQFGSSAQYIQHC